MVAARINFQQGAKRNIKPMETKDEQEYKGKNNSQNASKGNSSNNKAKDKGVYKGKNKLSLEEQEHYRKENKCFKSFTVCAKNENGIVIICIYVDDLIIGGDNDGEIVHVKSMLKKEFDMKDLGELRYFLGIEIIHTKEGIRKPHLDVVRRTLHYVSASTELQFSGFTDADWAGSACDRCAAITWSSKKQPTIALSSTEAKYRGAAVAACEGAWLELLLGDLGIQVQRPIVIHCDNLSSIQLAQNPMFHARTKHIEVHYHFIRKRVLDGSIDLTFVRTDKQVADMLKSSQRGSLSCGAVGLGPGGAGLEETEWPDW
ncbi:hypothetical protein L7F22_042565 [Adiantum nelumboides]|nr:hypothetical protein [Adiantum nelumboides]